MRRYYRNCGGYRGTRHKRLIRFKDTAVTRLLWALLTIVLSAFTGLYFALKEAAYIPVIAWALLFILLYFNTTKRRKYYAWMTFAALLINTGVALFIHLYVMTFMRDFFLMFLAAMTGGAA